MNIIKESGNLDGNSFSFLFIVCSNKCFHVICGSWKKKTWPTALNVTFHCDLVRTLWAGLTVLVAKII